MKSVLLVYENAADEPQQALDGRTPLQVARCASAARLALEGRCGVLGGVPAGEAPRAEALLAALCGVPAAEAWRLARGPLEAESLKLDWGAFDYAYRGDFITLDHGVIRDSWLSRLSLQETELLSQAVQASLDPDEVRMHALAPGHVVILVKAGDGRLDPGHAPWAVEGEAEASLPAGRRGKLPREIMEKAGAVLARQTINDVRVDLGENPASALWLWGGGPRAAATAPFGGRPLKAAMVTQSAMAAGLGLRLGMAVQPLLDPWAGQAAADVMEAGRWAGLLKDFDWVVVYVQAPAELVHGPMAEKVRLLDRMDLLLTAPMFEGIRKVKQRRVVVTTVDATMGEMADRRPRPCPALLWGAHVDPDATSRWDEPSCAAGDLGAVEPARLCALLAGD